nr:ABC transporter permease subunit [Pseudorhodoplanes sinuspersici]
MNLNAVLDRVPKSKMRRLPTLSLGDPLLRAWVYQALALGIVALTVWYLTANTLRNLELRGISTGFEFLWREAGLPIAETPIDYAPTDSYGRALLIGILNTLKVASLGIVLATLLGTMIGIAQLSRNWLLAKISALYVELLRDLPLLLQLLFWYTALQALPAARQAFNLLPGIFLSNRGLMLPALSIDNFQHLAVAIAAIVIVIAAAFFFRRSRFAKRQDGQRRRLWPSVLILAMLLPTAIFWRLGTPFQVDLPTLRGFNFRGGTLVSPEFFALLFGLVTYTAAFIAEIVRAGIIAVSKGQWEAGRALGLHNGLILRKIVMPQSLRLIIPPLTSQYLNLAKNSSLAVAIGYQDIVSIANTTLNQTGQAIEGIAIIMMVYLTISLSISLFMNWYNDHVALKGL